MLHVADAADNAASRANIHTPSVDGMRTKLRCQCSTRAYCEEVLDFKRGHKLREARAQAVRYTRDTSYRTLGQQHHAPPHPSRGILRHRSAICVPNCNKLLLSIIGPSRPSFRYRLYR